ncbi:hypothetical protein [Nocardia brasiliensis]|uniref:hypothetical protein n=1 Tax=Nocardia brasiliensis TaxID=37326 RepID=UPI0024562B3F|nr:hypothetical protein [Nocardia brasiliensis]
MNTVELHAIPPGQATPTAPAPITRKPLCADRPDDWDLDTGTPDAWRNAIEICGRCPLLGQCRELAETLTDRGDVPRAMIWAGVPYDNAGKIVENLDRYRTTPLDHRRPLQIIRLGNRPSTGGAVPVPHRHLILGQALTPTRTSA